MTDLITIEGFVDTAQANPIAKCSPSVKLEKPYESIDGTLTRRITLMGYGDIKAYTSFADYNADITTLRNKYNAAVDIAFDGTDLSSGMNFDTLNTIFTSYLKTGNITTYTTINFYENNNGTIRQLTLAYNIDSAPVVPTLPMFPVNFPMAF